MSCTKALCISTLLIAVIVGWSSHLFAQDAQDPELSTEYAHLAGLAEALSKPVERLKAQAAAIHEFATAWNNGTHPDAIEAKRVVTDYNAWLQQKQAALTAAEMALQQELNDYNARNKETFDSLTARQDALNLRIKNNNATIVDNDEYADQIDAFVENLNKIIEQVNNSANSDSVRAELQKQLDTLKPELESMKQEYSAKAQAIGIESTTIESERKQLQADNDDANEKFNAESDVLDQKAKDLEADEAVFSDQASKGVASAHETSAQIQARTKAKHAKMVEEFESLKAEIISKYSPEFASLLATVQQIISDHELHPERIYHIDNNFDLSFPGIAEMSSSLEKIAALLSAAPEGFDEIILSADEAATLRYILSNDEMLRGLGNAGLGMAWINKMLSFATPGPVKLVLKWNQALIEGWRKQNEALVNIAKAKNCEAIDFVLIDITENREFFESLYESRGCRD